MASNLKPYADLKVKVREYTDNDGKTKGVYIKIGTMFASPHLSHMFITLEAMPISKDWGGEVSVFKREEFMPETETEAVDTNVNF